MTFVLCNIRSAWNVGSALRTADCLGAKVILVGYTPRPVGANLKLIAKTAIGAEAFVVWEEFENSQQVFSKYHDQIHLAAEISDQSSNIFDFINQSTLSTQSNPSPNSNPNSKSNFAIWQQIKVENQVLIWFGNEIHGVEPEVLTRADRVLHLPMWGQKESLNVASSLAAFGYLLKFGIDNN